MSATTASRWKPPSSAAGACCRTWPCRCPTSGPCAAPLTSTTWCCSATSAAARQLLAEAAPADGKKRKIAIVTGAEGGFAAEEAEMAAKAGAKTVGLGPRILRCETAPLAVLAAVMTLTGNLE